MRAICIARHRFLSDHLCSIFAGAGVETTSVVGFLEGMTAAREWRPNFVVCEYDLLVVASLGQWECDPVLATVPIVAVSMSRRQDEAQMLASEGIAGFIYLPTTRDETVAKLARSFCRSAVRPSAVRPPADALRFSDELVEPTRPE